jgi:hypothetical protein
LGSLETAQDEKTEEAVRMEALSDGNQFYAGCKIRFFFLEMIFIMFI